MKKSFLLFYIVIGALLAQAQSKDEPYQTKSLANETFNSMKVETSGGNISVTGVSNGDAKIEMYVSDNRGSSNKLSKDEIQKRLAEHYELNISVSGNKLTAIAKPKTRNMNWRQALNISFRVYSPRSVATDLSTSGGNISLKDLTGRQDFSTSGGNLDIDNLGGDIRGRTSGGNIRVDNARDKIDLSTSGGNVDATKCNGTIRLTTSGGSIRLKELQGQVTASTSGGNVTGNNINGELSARTSGGNVRLEDHAGSLETSTSGGHIDVSIKELGKYVTITNSGGNVYLKLPPNKGLDLKLRGDKIDTGSLSNFSGSVEEDEVDGKINGGGVPVTVRAGSGRIQLAMK